MKRIAPAILLLAFATAVFAPAISAHANDGKSSYRAFAKKQTHFEKAVISTHGYHFSILPVKSTEPVYFSFPQATYFFCCSTFRNAPVFIQPIPLYLLHAVYRI